MKLVIYTQNKENYGAFDWDGKGACPQYWKNKGGEVYVVENLSERSIASINANGIPTLKSLIEHDSDYYMVRVDVYNIVEDDEVVCEEWEAPVRLNYNKVTGKWSASRKTVGLAWYGDNRVDGKVETWDLCNDQDSYRASYIVGKRLIPFDKIEEFLAS